MYGDVDCLQLRNVEFDKERLIVVVICSFIDKVAFGSAEMPIEIHPQIRYCSNHQIPSDLSLETQLANDIMIPW